MTWNVWMPGLQIVRQSASTLRNNLQSSNDSVNRFTVGSKTLQVVPRHETPREPNILTDLGQRNVIIQFGHQNAYTALASTLDLNAGFSWSSMAT